jgi:glyoxylase-like metal-dependent hydrolase (beta-lactamase superfamily II)
MKYKIYNLDVSLGTNTYLVWDEVSKDACIIDPSNKGQKILDFIKENNLNVKLIINTHAHYDHIGGNIFFKESLNIPVCTSKEASEAITDPKKNLSAYTGNEVRSPKADKILNDKDVIKLGDKKLTIITTPGHSACGISIYCDNLLFSGDTLFAESVGRTDLPGGNMNTLIKSIKEKLFILPDDVIVLPGHGGSTTIEYEKIGNPFVGIAARL